MAATNKVFSLKTVLACQDEISEKLKKVRTNLRSLDRAFDRVSRSAGDVASKVFAPLMAVGGAGLFSVASSVQTFIELGDAIDKASQRAGVGTGALQKLRFAAKLSGMEAEEMDRALSKLSGEMGKAASGENKNLPQLFSDLGVSWKDLFSAYAEVFLAKTLLERRRTHFSLPTQRCFRVSPRSGSLEFLFSAYAEVFLSPTGSAYSVETFLCLRRGVSRTVRIRL